MTLSSSLIASSSLPGTAGGFCNHLENDIEFTLHTTQSDYNFVAYHHHSGRIDK